VPLKRGSLLFRGERSHGENWQGVLRITGGALYSSALERVSGEVKFVEGREGNKGEGLESERFGYAAGGFATRKSIALGRNAGNGGIQVKEKGQHESVRKLGDGRLSPQRRDQGVSGLGIVA